MDKSYLNASLHILPEEVRIDLLAHGIHKVELSGNSRCLQCEAYDSQDNKVDVLPDEIKTSLYWVIAGLSLICAQENLEKVKVDLVDDRLVTDGLQVPSSKVKFVEMGDGTIQFLGGKYDGATLYQIDDYDFLYGCLSGDVIERIYSKIKEYADELKMIEEFEEAEFEIALAK